MGIEKIIPRQSFTQDFGLERSQHLMEVNLVMLNWLSFLFSVHFKNKWPNSAFIQDILVRITRKPGTRKYLGLSGRTDSGKLKSISFMFKTLLCCLFLNCVNKFFILFKQQNRGWRANVSIIVLVFKSRCSDIDSGVLTDTLNPRAQISNLCGSDG